MTSITQLLSPWPITKHSVVLREQLMSQSNTTTPPRDQLDNMQQSSPASPNDPSGGDMLAGISNSADSDGGDGNGDGRKGYGKRELSTSKRAAQNRAAQVSSHNALFYPLCPNAHRRHPIFRPVSGHEEAMSQSHLPSRQKKHNATGLSHNA